MGTNEENVHADTNKSLRLPLGVSSFERAASGGYYLADKTLLIRDVLDDGAQAILFTRPRRFGKTLNMDMLRLFFEIPPEGADTASLFRDKKIWACGESYTCHQGHYPVVFLTFKDVKYATWEEASQKIARILQSEVARHDYLLESARVSEIDRHALRRIYQLEAPTAELTDALLVLTRALASHHGTPAVVIIDEYDAPIQQGHRWGYYDQAVLFMRTLFSGGLKDNLHLFRGFMTGVLRVAKEGILSGLNNLEVSSVLDLSFAEFFGFTPNEVQAMAAYYGVPEKYSEICAWYDGYRFGDADIFNPWSVISYFNNRYLAQPYWVSTSDNAILGEILAKASPSTIDNVRSLMEGTSLWTPVEIGTVYPRIADDPTSVWSYLLMTGYLKAVERRQLPSGAWFYRVAIPNREISLVYASEVLGAVRDVLPAVSVGEVQGAVIAGDADALQTALSNLLVRIGSVRDPAGEGFYHGFVLGLVAMLDGLGYRVRSNRESGMGYFDVALEPTEPNGPLPGVVMEFKALRAPQAPGEADPGQLDASLDALAREALSQIASRDYAYELRDAGAVRILTYGIAFCGKHVRVQSAEA